MEEYEKSTKQHNNLFQEYERWKPLFKDVRDFINPYIGYFEDETQDSGQRCDDEMLRTMNIKYAQILAAGLQWGVTSPTRPWLKLAVKNDALMQMQSVQAWLQAVQDITLDILHRGNFYQENHKAYLELACFCTSAMMIEEDEDDVIHCHTFTMGEYALGCDRKGMINQFARNIQMTPYQIVDRFGEENVPPEILREYKEGTYTGYHKIKHLICPNPDYVEGKQDVDSMQYRDYYWVDGNKKFLSVSGFPEFPIMVERYQTKGADVYGTGPGIWSLGDAKQIQMIQKDICTAVELGIKPPVQASSEALRNSGINYLPMGVTFYNGQGGTDAGVKPLFQVNLDIEHARQMVQDIEECIKQHFNVDTFQLLSQMESGTRTATEVVQLTAEKMSLMGPLLESLQGYLGRIFDRVYSIALRAGAYPEPPEELQGQQLDLQFVSILAQAQQQSGITPIMSWVQSVGQLAQIDPNVINKVNAPEVSDELAEMYGVPVKCQNSDDVYQATLQQQQQQQQEQMAAMQIQQGVQTAKTASEINPDAIQAVTQ